jgi:sugar O-acyltransferase (sialic acid O-acetyltransferase NeuD family)
VSDVILIGASGLAREVAAAAASDRLHVVGILDDDPGLHGSTVDGIQVIGAVRDAVDLTLPLLLCVGSGLRRRALAERLAANGVGDERFATFVDPSVRVPRGCAVGPGSVLLAGVVLTTAVRLGRHCVVMPNATLTHDNELHDYVTVAAGVCLGGGVTVREAAYLGMNASVRQNVTIGAGATVGMGAVVLHDVPTGETWTGVPADAMLVRS